MIARSLYRIGPAALSLAVIVGWAVGSTGNSADSAAPRDEFRLREGSTLKDEPGVFQDTGERIVFQSRSRQTPLTVLENLALERISTALEEDRTPRQWTVSGTLTEYRGANYLLVSRALRRARSAENSALSTVE